jgi:hypothetical protein
MKVFLLSMHIAMSVITAMMTMFTTARLVIHRARRHVQATPGLPLARSVSLHGLAGLIQPRQIGRV